MSEALIGETERLRALRSLGLLDIAVSEDFDQITRLTAYSFDVPVSLIALVDADRQKFLSRVGLALRETPRDMSICAHAIQGKGILEVEDLSADPRFRDNPLVTGEPHMRFYAGTPLITDSGHAIGALCIIDNRPRCLRQEDRAQLQALGKMVMDLVALRQSVGRRDAVTGLPNRHQIVIDVGALKALGQTGRRSFVLIDVLDLEAAHELAQAMGIVVVDSLLRLSAQRARQALPAYVALYHVGVTRFAFWFDPQRDPDLLQTLDAALREPAQAAGIPMQLKLHCGVVPFDLETVDASDLLRMALTVVNTAVSNDKFVCLYEPQDDVRLQRRYALALALRHALNRHEFFLVYQPRIDIVEGRVTAFEALIRWRHPVHGLVSPGEFIPILERTTLMQSLTLWVIEESLRQLAQWRNEFPHLRVSVNLSPRDFDNDLLVGGILQACSRLRADLSWLEFEVTEGEWLHRSESVTQQMSELVEHGAILAIDDFGAGYSNFAYMNQVPATVLKIDQSLIVDAMQNERHAALVKEIAQLAHRMGYRTIAEGVESKDVYDFVQDCGCDEVQGFFFSRPLEVAHVADYVRAFQMPDGQPVR